MNYLNLYKLQLNYQINIMKKQVQQKFNDIQINLIERIKSNQLKITNHQIELLIKLKYQNLLKLNLGNNKLAKIQFLTYLNFPKLNTLYLYQNLIQDLQPLTRSSTLKNLQKLYLWDNQISNINALQKCNIPKLKILTLQKNYVHEFECLLNTDLSNIEQLCMNNNKITNLNDLIKMNLCKIRQLWLSIFYNMRRSKQLCDQKCKRFVKIIKSSIFKTIIHSIIMNFIGLISIIHKNISIKLFKLPFILLNSLQIIPKMHYNNKNIRNLLQDNQQPKIQHQIIHKNQTLFTYSFPIKLFTQHITSRYHFQLLLNKEYQQHPQYSRSFNLKIKQHKKCKRATITCSYCTAKIEYDLNQNQTIWTLKKYKNYHQHSPHVQNSIKNLAKKVIAESLHLNDRENYLNVLKKYDLKKDYFNRGKNQVLNRCEFHLVKKFLDKLSYDYQYLYQYEKDPKNIGLPDIMIILSLNSKELYRNHNYLLKYETIETIVKDRSYSNKKLEFGIFYGYNNSRSVQFALSIYACQNSEDVQKMFHSFFNLMENVYPNYVMTEQRVQFIIALQNIKNIENLEYEHIFDPYLYLLDLKNQLDFQDIQRKQMIIQNLKCMMKEYSPIKGNQSIKKLQKYCNQLKKPQIFDKFITNKNKLCFWMFPKKFMGSYHIENTCNGILMLKKKLKKSKNTLFMIKKYHDFNQKYKNQKLKFMKMFESYKFEDLFEDDKILLLRNQLQKYHFLIFMENFHKSQLYIILKSNNTNQSITNIKFMSDNNTDILIKNQYDQSIINIINWSCQCGLFQKLGIPCEHIIAAYRQLFPLQNYENIIDSRIMSQYPGPLLRLNQQRQINRRFNHRRKCRSRRNHL